MPENSWTNTGTPPENMTPPENKPLWAWQADNITTDAPVGFSITEDSTPFIRSADNGPWIPAEITAENVAVGGLKINVSENVSDVVITTLPLEPEDLPEDVTSPEENSCEFFQVDTNISPDSIENAEIGIKVDQDWITANNLDDNSITLQHCVDGGWTELPTTITGEDENYLYCSAEAPSFSVFAVTGETVAVAAPEIPTSEVPSAEIPVTTIAAIAIVVLAMATVIVWQIRKR
jgi:PGF-pre-PGF domain-containing protein